MKLNIKGTNTELTPQISGYVSKKMDSLEKLISGLEVGGGQAIVNFEVGKSTNHHRSGEVFHADCLVKATGKEFYASADREDLYSAVDEVREILFRDMNKDKNREQTLYRRGAISIKKMLKGLSNRNPFTSKY